MHWRGMEPVRRTHSYSFPSRPSRGLRRVMSHPTTLTNVAPRARILSQHRRAAVRMEGRTHRRRAVAAFVPRLKVFVVAQSRLLIWWDCRFRATSTLANRTPSTPKDMYKYETSTRFDIMTSDRRFADELGFYRMPSSRMSYRYCCVDRLSSASETVRSPVSPSIWSARNSRTRMIHLSPTPPLPFGETGAPDVLTLAGIAEMTVAVEMYLLVPGKTGCDGEFYTAFYRCGSEMRALLWIFNDLWATPTWAAVESTNRQSTIIAQ